MCRGGRGRGAHVPRGKGAHVEGSGTCTCGRFRGQEGAMGEGLLKTLQILTPGCTMGVAS